MGKKDWSTLRNEHKSRFAKRQLEEETSLVKSSASTNQSIENRDERLEEKLPKETEVIDSSIFPEPVKQVEELKDQSELGTEKAIDEQNEVLVEDSPDRPLTSQPLDFRSRSSFVRRRPAPRTKKNWTGRPIGYGESLSFFLKQWSFSPCSYFWFIGHGGIICFYAFRRHP